MSARDCFDLSSDDEVEGVVAPPCVAHTATAPIPLSPAPFVEAAGESDATADVSTSASLVTTCTSVTVTATLTVTKRSGIRCAADRADKRRRVVAAPRARAYLEPKNLETGSDCSLPCVFVQRPDCKNSRPTPVPIWPQYVHGDEPDATWVVIGYSEAWLQTLAE